MSKQSDLLNLTDAISVSGTNVGIGTSSPQAKLHIVSHANQEPMTLQATTNGYSYITYKNSAGTDVAYTGLGGGAAVVTGTTADYAIRATANLLFGAGSSSERMRIDSAGRVTMPYQPAFSAVRETSAPSGSDVILNGIWANVGGHYNTANGRFTCPVAGTYMFSCSGLANPTGSTSRWSIKLNGTSNKSSESRQQGGTVGAYLYGTSQTIITLSANDYVTMYYYNDDGSTQLYGDSTPYITFSGHLIG